MKMRRRQLIALGAAATGSALALSWFSQQRRVPQSSLPMSPSLITSQDGLLEAHLQAAWGKVQVAQQQAQVMSYNGQLPGPRLEVKPGDTLRIHFANQLDQPTNLHYHGLHVTPEGRGDNVFLSVLPGETLTYEFTLPSDHPAGTFWYHPHHHGHVAEQVFAGLAGLLIVRGDLDEIPEIKAAQEAFLVLKDFAFDRSGQISGLGHMARMMGREGSLLTVNGQQQPNLTIPQGGLLRLRLLNASASRFYQLQLERHSLYVIATDGGALAAPVEVDQLLLAPGERVEVLVQGTAQPGQYRLLNLPYDRWGMGQGGMGGMGGMMGGGMGGMMGQSSQANTPQVLATVSYGDPATPLPLPEQLLPVAELPAPTLSRRIELSMSMGMGMGMGMTFLFNGQPFDANRVDVESRLNTVEEWELVNVDPDRMDHPFHLHVNPFQVISRNGQPEPYRAWKDTVLVKGGETVRIRIPFRDFTGKTVYHCHILDHEDLGMMGQVQITT